MLLAIDTSQMNYSVALSNGWHTEWSDVQITLYDQLKSQDLSSLSGIVINIGPGRFSGLRSGIAFAKGLATAMNIPIYTVNQFDLIADLVTDKAFTVILDARKGEVYSQTYFDHKPSGEITLTKTINASNLYGNIAPAKVIKTNASTLMLYANKHNLTQNNNPIPIYIRKSVD